MLAAGEDLVAYEILCDNLYEIDLRPPVDLTRELRQAAEGRTSGMRSRLGHISAFMGAAGGHGRSAHEAAAAMEGDGRQSGRHRQELTVLIG
jgi:hypothetical protein